MSRRGNGLQQTSTWVTLIDVTPVLADRLVELLGDTGVAAYAEASSEGSAPAPLSTPIGARPSDRVYVGQGDLSRARALLDEHRSALQAEAQSGPGAEMAMPAVDVESAFAGIVAGWDRPSTQVGAWSALEDVSAAEEVPRRTDAKPDATTDDWGATAPTPAPLQQPPEDPADHFVPPPPPPLPRGDRVTRAAWVGLVGGPLVLLLAALTGTFAERGLGVAAVVVTLAGFATLVARMPDRPSRDDDPDDGARV